MARGVKRAIPTINEFIGMGVKAISDVLDKDLTFASDLSTTTYGLKDEIKELEKKIAELSLRDPRPRRRVKSIKIKF